MQIISKIDMAFVVFYALLIPLVGALVFFISGQVIVLLRDAAAAGRLSVAGVEETTAAPAGGRHAVAAFLA